MNLLPLPRDNCSIHFRDENHISSYYPESLNASAYPGWTEKTESNDKFICRQPGSWPGTRRKILSRNLVRVPSIVYRFCQF